MTPRAKRKLSQKQTKKTEEKGNCFNCNAEVGEDLLCYGCGKYVCEDCDSNYNLMGHHNREEHLVDPLYE